MFTKSVYILTFSKFTHFIFKQIKRNENKNFKLKTYKYKLIEVYNLKIF